MKLRIRAKAKIRAKVVVHEMHSSFTPIRPVSAKAIIGTDSQGPLTAPVFLGVRTPPAKWWQPWLWRSRARQRALEAEQAKEDFNRIFGPPYL